MKNILEALMNVSNFPELRERASLCICSWKAEHEDVYTDFKNKMDNISTGDLTALEEMSSPILLKRAKRMVRRPRRIVFL